MRGFPLAKWRLYLAIPLVLTAVTATAFHRREATGVKDRAGARVEAIRANRDYAFDPYRNRDGAAEAAADIAKGKPRMLFYGRVGVGRRSDCALLKSRFGIEAQTIAGCVVSDGLVRFAADYNARIRRYIAERFGRDALARLKA